jgi:hypothetical protein
MSSTAGAVEDDADCINPADYVPEGVEVVHEGIVWKLNSDGNAYEEKTWRKRRMWLTDQGVLQYYSRKHKSALGRPVSGLRLAKIDDEKYAFGCAFEIHPPSLMDGETLPPTTLSALQEEERELWLTALEKYKEVELLPTVSTGRKKGEDAARKRINVFGATTKAKMTEAKDLSAPTIEITESSKPPTPATGVRSPRHVLSRPGSSAGGFRNPKRRDSQHTYTDANQTIIVLDWDDTIFPTTWVKEDLKLNWRYTPEQQLKPGETLDTIVELLGKLSDRMSFFLQQASNSAKVVIVTLAKRPWVKNSCENFCPSLLELIDRLGIPVVYAQESVDKEMQCEYAKDEFKSNDQLEIFWSRVKGKAIYDAVNEFYES